MASCVPSLTAQPHQKKSSYQPAKKQLIKKITAQKHSPHPAGTKKTDDVLQAYNRFELRTHLNTISDQLEKIKQRNQTAVPLELETAWAMTKKLMELLEQEPAGTSQTRGRDCNNDAFLDMLREKLIDIRRRIDQVGVSVQVATAFIPISNSLSTTDSIIIAKDGYYKLVEPIIKQIIIAADNVTLDLNGQTISYAGIPPDNGASALLIQTDGGLNPRKNIQILNGGIGSGIQIVRHHPGEIGNAFGIHIQEGATQIVIDGVRFRDMFNDAIHIETECSNIIIRNCSIDDTSGNGVFIAQGTSGVSLQNVNFQDCQKAALMCQGSTLNVDTALFVDNRGPGILLQGTATDPVLDCTFKDVDIVLSNCGIQLDNTQKISFNRTTIKKSTLNGFVIGQNCPNTSFTNGEIKESGQNGIQNNSSNVTLDTVLISDSGMSGILSEGLTTPITGLNYINIGIKMARIMGVMLLNVKNSILRRITANQIMDNDGIFIDDRSSNITLEDINVDNCAGVGVHVHANDSSLNGGTINNCNRGIEAHGETKVQEGFSASNMIISNNATEGILIMNSMHPSIKTPTIVSAQTGIMIDSESMGAHLENPVIKMVSTGVESRGSDVHIDHGAFHNVSGSALLIGSRSEAAGTETHRAPTMSGDNYTINGVTIQNAQQGIEIASGNNLLVTGVRIVNTETGIMTSNAANQVIVDKTLIQNSQHNAIMVQGSSLDIKDSTIQNSGGTAVMIMGTAQAPLQNISIKNLSISQAANDPAMEQLFGCSGIELVNVQHVLVKNSDLNGIGTVAGTMPTKGINIANSLGVHVVDSSVQNAKSSADVMGIAVTNSVASSIIGTAVTDNLSTAGAATGVFIDAQSINTEVRDNDLTNNVGNTDSAGLLNESPTSVIFDNTALFNSQNNIVGAPPLPPQPCCIGNISIGTAQPIPPPCDPATDPDCTIC